MAEAAQGQGQQGQGQGQGRGWGGLLWNLLIMYMMFNMFNGNRSTTTPAVPNADGVAGVVPGSAVGNMPTGPMVDENGQQITHHMNKFGKGVRFKLQVYVSEDPLFEDFANNQALVWQEQDIVYGAWGEEYERSKDIRVPISQNVQNNGSLYAHAYITQHGFSPDPSSPSYHPSASCYRRKRLNVYLKKPRVTMQKNLLTGKEEEVLDTRKAAKGEEVLISYWNPNMTVQVVEDFSAYPMGRIPQQIGEHMDMDAQGRFCPIVFFNDFWTLRNHLYPVNDTLDELPLHMEYSPIGLIKWTMMVQMDQSFEMQEQFGSSSEGDKDEFKRMLLETNPYLLGVTFVVSILHMVFDFLAFKNDIQFWKNAKNMEGLSIRSLFINAGSQIIIFLYLLDNDTSFMILISAGIGCLIECWKINKAVIVKVDRNGSFPWVTFEDRDSYVSKTKEYDEMAMKYLSWALVPLLLGYAVYSLYYETHKSWYSYVLGTLTGAVYTFGFIMMCPQLFINYKLKSVAHLPWRTFVYKALNTFIDDLFAFIITMPTMHRLSCFRDDLVFIVYMIQRYIYRVDPKRTEDGFVPEDEADGDDTTKKLASSSKADDGSSSSSSRTSSNDDDDKEGDDKGAEEEEEQETEPKDDEAKKND